MAEKKDKFRYSEEKKKLDRQEISRCYLLYGPEEYLKEVFADNIRKAVLPDDDGFSFKKFSDNDFDAADIDEAVNSVPFLSEHTLVEVHDLDLNKFGEQLLPVISDIPDYCTVVFIQNSEFSPDFRLKSNKYIRENYSVFNIAVQSQNELTRWISRRFAAEGKKIGAEAAEQLIFLSGSSMNGLIPEINKIASAVTGDMITPEDVTKYAHHLPEADVFEMVEKLSQGDNRAAVSMMAELLDSKSSEPIQLLAIIASQYKRLYAASIAKEEKKNADWLVSSEVVKFDWLARKLLNMGSRYSEERLADILCTLTDADYKMKTGAGDNTDVLKDVLIYLTAGGADA